MEGEWAQSGGTCIAQRYPRSRPSKQIDRTTALPSAQMSQLSSQKAGDQPPDQPVLRLDSLLIALCSTHTLPRQPPATQQCRAPSTKPNPRRQSRSSHPPLLSPSPPLIDLKPDTPDRLASQPPTNRFPPLQSRSVKASTRSAWCHQARLLPALSPSTLFSRKQSKRNYFFFWP